MAVVPPMFMAMGKGVDVPVFVANSTAGIANPTSFGLELAQKIDTAASTAPNITSLLTGDTRNCKAFTASGTLTFAKTSSKTCLVLLNLMTWTATEGTFNSVFCTHML